MDPVCGKGQGDDEATDNEKDLHAKPTLCHEVGNPLSSLYLCVVVWIRLGVKVDVAMKQDYEKDGNKAQAVQLWKIVS